MLIADLSGVFIAIIGNVAQLSGCTAWAGGKLGKKVGCANGGGPGESTVASDDAPPQPGPQQGNDTPSGCHAAYVYVLQPDSGKIASGLFSTAAGLFVAGITLDDAKLVKQTICFAFAALAMAGAVVAGLVFARHKVVEGRRNHEGANEANESVGAPTA